MKIIQEIGVKIFIVNTYTYIITYTILYAVHDCIYN